MLFALLAIGALCSAIVAVVATTVAGDSVEASTLGTFGVPFAALIAVVATAGSLYYSESAGFIPCEFCWYQRIAMYPLAVVLPIAAVRRDRAGALYGIVLASIGVVLSSYHLWLQNGGGDSDSCRSTVPCSAKLVNQWGVISIPTMALLGFLGIIGWCWVSWKFRNDDTGVALPHDDKADE